MVCSKGENRFSYQMPILMDVDDSGALESYVVDSNEIELNIIKLAATPTTSSFRGVEKANKPHLKMFINSNLPHKISQFIAIICKRQLKQIAPTNEDKDRVSESQ